MQLRPEGETVRLQLLKDHDNTDLSELNLRLDPATMRVVDEDLPPHSNKPRDASRFHLYSGGARGAEAEFGRSAERWGVGETHFSFDGHPFLERERGVVILDDDELKRGDFSLVYASHRLHRQLSQILNIKRILQTSWHQISRSNEVFVVVLCRTALCARHRLGRRAARPWSKPVCLFDQEKGSWFRWDAVRWREEAELRNERTTFAASAPPS